MSEGISVFMMSPDVFVGYIILGSTVGGLLARAMYEITAYVIKAEEKRFNGDDELPPPRNPNAPA